MLMNPEERKKYEKEWGQKKVAVRLEKELFLQFKLICMANKLNPTKVFEEITFVWIKKNAKKAGEVIQALG